MRCIAMLQTWPASARTNRLSRLTQPRRPKNPAGNYWDSNLGTPESQPDTLAG